MILPHTTVDGIIHLLGRQFKSMEAAERFEAAYIERAEKAAGRRLSAAHLVKGVQHREDRDREQIVSDRAFYATVNRTDPAAKNEHPFDAADAQLANQKQTYEGLSQKMRAAYDKRVARSDLAAAKRRQQAITHAYSVWESVAFDATVPESVVERARQMLYAAEHRSLDDYKSGSEDLIRRIADHKRSRATAIELQRAEALAGLPDQFEKVEPMAQRQAPYSWDEIKSESDPAERHRMWTANEEHKAAAE